MRNILIWIFGILACFIFGSIIVERLSPGDGPIGGIGAALAFACLRLWLVPAASKGQQS
jgi:hypothetical protein